MSIVDIHEAKTLLSRLIDLAAKGELFIITKASKPLVMVTAVSAPAERKVQRLGFLAGENRTPDDFDRMGEAEIERLFGVGE